MTQTPALDYEISWGEGAAIKVQRLESARQACTFAKTLIDRGRAGVQIREPSGSIFKARAILDISDIIYGRDLEK